MGKKAFKLDHVTIRLVKGSPIYSETQIKSPEDAIRLMGEVLCELDRETICIINLKSDGTPINCNFASVGTINMAVAAPRELLKSTILSNAASVIVMHNHPSNNVNPSKEDAMLTDKLINVYKLMDIDFLDHIIVGTEESKFFSFREKNMLDVSSFKYITDYRLLDFPQIDRKHLVNEDDRRYLLELSKKVFEKRNPRANIDGCFEHLKEIEESIKQHGYKQTIGFLKDELRELDRHLGYASEISLNVNTRNI